MISTRLRALSAVQAIDLHLSHGATRPYGTDLANAIKLAGELTGVAYASDRAGAIAAAADLRALLGGASTRHVFYLDALRDAYALDPQALDADRYAFVASTDAEDVFRVMNVVDGNPKVELPLRLGCRSMSVGDVYVEGEVAFFCAPCGWEEIRGSFVEALMAKLTREEDERRAADAAQPFCACGRRFSECDRSRAGCVKRGAS